MHKLLGERLKDAIGSLIQSTCNIGAVLQEHRYELYTSVPRYILFHSTPLFSPPLSEYAEPIAL